MAWWHRRSVLKAIVPGLALLFAAAPGDATAIREAPWHPLAAAYRGSVFLADLVPIPWSKVEAAWAEPYPGAATAQPGIEWLAELASLRRWATSRCAGRFNPFFPGRFPRPSIFPTKPPLKRLRKPTFRGGNTG